MSKKKPPPAAAPSDLDTVYRPDLTGKDIDLLGNLIDAWVKYTGQQKAALLREMLLEQAALDMGLQSANGSIQSEVPQLALFRA